LIKALSKSDETSDRTKSKTEVPLEVKLKRALQNLTYSRSPKLRYLKQKVKVKTQESNEHEVIVCSPTGGLSKADMELAPINSSIVHAVLEVKRTITSATIKTANSEFQRIKILSPDIPRFLFAYQAYQNGNATRNNFKVATSKPQY
ncbi:unnamed protein product, partial [Didymodactylos carnosus]